MAKIKNTRELVLRARGHARADHVRQGTYGLGRANGEVEFKGCAIGCLATPHRKRDLRAFIRKNFLFGRVELESDSLVRLLTKEFGISNYLARAAEDVFEGLAFNGDAINFIPAFAQALNEGATIRWNQADKFRSIFYDHDNYGSWEAAQEALAYLASIR